MDEEEIKRRILFGAGYGNPPEHSRFRKGQSGNPKGRPKKPSPDAPIADQRTLGIVLAVADKRVPVRDGGGMTEMSMIEAVLAATAASAIKGNARSQSTFIDLAQKADAARACEIRRRNEIWSKYKTVMTAELADAAKRGEPPPEILPHPDDIIIDHDNGPRFLGPMEEYGQSMLDETIRYRDVLIMQDALDHRSTHRHDGTPLTQPGGAGLLAMLMERAIPPRLRLTDAQWVWRSMKFDAMPKRVLLKKLYEAWRQAGSPHQRGYVFPDLDVAREKIELVIYLVREVKAHRLDPDRMTNKEWVDEVTVIANQYLAGAGRS